jgi:hypothetical protein
MPEMLSLSIKNQNFSGRGPPDPHLFLTNHIRAGGNGTGGKIGASEAIQKRLEWENLTFFAA